MTIPSVDPGPVRVSGDASLCWGESCWRSPLPGAGPAVEADPLGLCPRCREEIVGSAPRDGSVQHVD